MIGMDSTVPTHYSSFPLGELLDYWDLPLATEDRAALLAELQERGYRTDGLPEVQSVPKAQSVSKKQTTPVVPEGPTGWIAFSRIGLALSGGFGLIASVLLLLFAIDKSFGDTALLISAVLAPSLALLFFASWSGKAPERALPPALVIYGVFFALSEIMSFLRTEALFFPPHRILIGLAFVWVLHKGAQQALANAAREDENTELDLDDEGALAE